MPKLNGSTHINLTVRDLERSSAWYCDVLGFRPLRDAEPAESGFVFRTLVHRSAFASVVLGQCKAPAPPTTTEPFDERRVGLHHLAFHVPDRAELDRWAAHLDRVGAENTGVEELFLEAGYGIWLRDPDNIWLELYWMNTAFFMGRMREQWQRDRRAERPAPVLG